jgi:hypothetical protein
MPVGTLPMQRSGQIGARGAAARQTPSVQRSVSGRNIIYASAALPLTAFPKAPGKGLALGPVPTQTHLVFDTLDAVPDMKIQPAKYAGDSPRAMVDVVFAPDAGLGAWLAVETQENYSSRDEIVTCKSTLRDPSRPPNRGQTIVRLAFVLSWEDK